MRAAIALLSSIPLTRQAPTRQRSRDAAGTDGELEYRAAGGQVLEDVDNGSHDLGGVRAALGVVARSHAFGEPTVGRVIFLPEAGRVTPVGLISHGAKR
jgi:hypothetical protein